MAAFLQMSCDLVRAKTGPFDSQRSIFLFSQVEVSFKRRTSGTESFTPGLITRGQCSPVHQEQGPTSLVSKNSALQKSGPPPPVKRKVLVHQSRSPSPPEQSGDASDSRGWTPRPVVDLPWITRPKLQKLPVCDVGPLARGVEVRERHGDYAMSKSERSKSIFGAEPTSQTVEFHDEEERGGGGDEMHRTSAWIGRILQEDEAFFIGVGTAKVEAGFTQVEQKQMELLVERLHAAPISLTPRRFSMTMRSVQLKITRARAVFLVKELGARASWRRAIDVVQWLASREGGATRADKFVYTTLLATLGREQPGEVVPILRAMMSCAETWPDRVAYQAAARVLGRAGRLQDLLLVVGMMREGPDKEKKEFAVKGLQGGMPPDLAVYNAVLNACVAKRQWKAVSWVFENMADDCVKPNAASYGIAIEVMGQCGQREEAHRWLGRLEEAGYRPNARTLKGLVKVAASADEAEQLVRQVAEDDTQAGVAGLYFAMACALCREGRWQEASRMIPKMQRLEDSAPPVTSWTGLIRASFEAGHVAHSIALFEAMPAVCRLNLTTLALMMRVYDRGGQWGRAWGLYQQMQRGEGDMRLFESALGLCVKGERWEAAEEVLGHICEGGWDLDADRHAWMMEAAARAGQVRVLNTMADLIRGKMRSTEGKEGAQNEVAEEGGVDLEQQGASLSGNLQDEGGGGEGEGGGVQLLRGRLKEGLGGGQPGVEAWMYAICSLGTNVTTAVASYILRELEGEGWVPHYLLYSDLIKALLLNGGAREVETVLGVVERMEGEGLVGDVGLYSAVIRGCYVRHRRKDVVRLASRMKRLGYELDPRTAHFVNLAEGTAVVTRVGVRARREEGGVEVEGWFGEEELEKGDGNRKSFVMGVEVPSALDILAGWST